MTGGGCVEWQRGSSAAEGLLPGGAPETGQHRNTQLCYFITTANMQHIFCYDEAVSLENRVWTGMQPEPVPHSPVQVLPGYTNTVWAGGAACSTVTHLTIQARDCTEISITVRD